MIVLALLHGVSTAKHGGRIAAQVDGKEIPVQAVDAMSPAVVRSVHLRLTELAQETVHHIIGLRLGIRAVTSAGARGGGAPMGTAADASQVERNARQFLFEREQRAKASARRREELYRAHEVRIHLPPPEALESRLEPERVVAYVDGKPLRAAVVENAGALRLYRLRGELYLQRRRNLEKLIEQELLRAEARGRGISLRQLERLLAQPHRVSDEQLQSFLEKERAAGRPAGSAQRARPYLEFLEREQRRTRLVRQRRAQADIRILLEPPARPRLPMRLEGGLELGPAGGPVLVAYTNYRCEPCRATHREIDRLLAGERPPRVVLRDFIPRYDPSAVEAAALVRCASRSQGTARVRGALLRAAPAPFGRTWLTDGELESLASLARMTPSALRACMRSREVLAQVERDTEEAHLLGFEDAPAFVAEGVPLSGMQSAELLRQELYR